MLAPFGFQVFQLEAVCAFLLRLRGQYTLLHFALPGTLRVVDRVTTETTKAIIDEVLTFPRLKELLEAFPLVVHLTCNDRCGSNNAAEKCLFVAKDKDTHRLRTTCEVHKIHTCTSYQLDCQKDLASGIVNLGLAQRPGGAFGSLKNAVKLFFMARMQVLRDVAPPRPDSPEHRYRLAVLDLYLPGSTQHRGSTQFKGSTQFQLKRRMVLTAILNGDWESAECISHYCCGACCNNGAIDKEALCNDVAEALLPAKCPVFARHRWANAEAPTNWAGLLQGVHHTLGIVGPVWLRELAEPSKPAKAQDFELVEAPGQLAAFVDNGNDDLGPCGLVGESSGNVQPVAQNSDDEFEQDNDPAFGQLEPPQSEQKPAESIDWEEFNKRVRLGVKECIALPYLSGCLAVMRIAMAPLLHLMLWFLNLTGDEYTSEMFARASEDKVAFRVLECARQCTRPFYQEVQDRLFDSSFWHAVPKADRNSFMSGLLFRKLSSAAGAVYAHISQPHQVYPFRLFLLLCPDLLGSVREEIVAELTDINKRCLLDSFTLDFCKHYNSADRILSMDARQHLRSIACLLRVDIAFLEAKHATLRRTSLRGVQTWMASLLKISADMFLLQRRKQEKTRFQGRVDTSKNKGKGHKHRRRRGGRKKGPAGSAQGAGSAQVTGSAQEPSMKRRAVSYRRRQADRGKGGRRGVVTAWNVFYKRERAGKPGVPDREERQSLKRKYQELPLIEKQELASTAKRRTQETRGLLVPGVAETIAQTRAAQQRLVAETVPDALRELQVMVAFDGGAGNLSARLEHMALAHQQKVQLDNLESLHQAEADCVAVAVASREFIDKFTLLQSLPPEVQRGLAVVACLDKLQLVEWRCPVGQLAQHIMQCSGASTRAAVLHEWTSRFEMVKHKGLQRCSPAGYKKPSTCSRLGFCVCKSNLPQFEKAFVAKWKLFFPPKTKERQCLRMAGIFLALVDRNEERRWFHAAYTNLVTFNTVLLEMRCLICKDDIATLEVMGAPGAEGQAGSAQWLLSLEVFATCSRDNASGWAVEAWSLHCPKGRLPHLRPWRVYVKRMHEPVGFWPAPPRSPPRNRRRKPPDEQGPERVEAPGFGPVGENGLRPDGDEEHRGEEREEEEEEEEEDPEGEGEAGEEDHNDLQESHHRVYKHVCFPSRVSIGTNQAAHSCLEFLSPLCRTVSEIPT